MKEEHTRTREEERASRGEEGEGEAREGGGMPRSRGNRLPRERVAPLSPLLSSLLLTALHPSLLFVLSRRPRLQPLALSHRRPTQTSFSSSVVEDLSSSRFLSSCLPREEEARRNKSGFPPSFSSVSIVFIVPWISTPPSSGNRRYRCTGNTNAHMYGPRRIVPAPFFERDSSPISFRSPVIN